MRRELVFPLLAWRPSPFFVSSLSHTKVPNLRLPSPNPPSPTPCPTLPAALLVQLDATLAISIYSPAWSECQCQA